MRVSDPRPARLLKRFSYVCRVLAMFAAGALYLSLGGCATWQAPAKVDDTALRARAVSIIEQDVRLSAAVLSAEDSRQMLGTDVNGTGVQPVWIEVENPTPQALWLLHSGTDPDYFSPLEVAWSFHAPLAGAANTRLDDHFAALAFENPIPARSTRAGIIFANPHRRIRLLNVDLLGRRKLIPFTLFPPVPDDVSDTAALQVLARFDKAQGTDYSDPDAFRAALEQLPCCATQANGTASGDPLNVVLVGEFADIAAAFVRRGFRRDEMEFDNAQRLFGRPPDVVGRKSGQGGVPANWVRLWVAPLRYRGQSVFLVQTGRPVGGRFTVAEGKALVLHPDVDEARNLLVQDLLYSGGLAKLGFVAGVGSISIARPWVNPAESSYHTDGLRAVMFLATRPLALSDVQILDWVPYLKRREAGAAKENTNAQ